MTILRTRRWKLWHFSMLVLVVGLVLGAVLAIARMANGTPTSEMVALVIGCVTAAVIVLVSVEFSRVILRGGRSLSRVTTSRGKDWGVRRGGVVGFLAWVVALGLEGGFVFVTLVIAPATIFLFLMMLSLAFNR